MVAGRRAEAVSRLAEMRSSDASVVAMRLRFSGVSMPFMLAMSSRASLMAPSALSEIMSKNAGLSGSSATPSAALAAGCMSL